MPVFDQKVALPQGDTELRKCEVSLPLTIYLTLTSLGSSQMEGSGASPRWWLHGQWARVLHSSSSLR